MNPRPGDFIEFRIHDYEGAGAVKRLRTWANELAVEVWDRGPKESDHGKLGIVLVDEITKNYGPER